MVILGFLTNHADCDTHAPRRSRGVHFTLPRGAFFRGGVHFQEVGCIDKLEFVNPKLLLSNHHSFL